MKIDWLSFAIIHEESNPDPELISRNLGLTPTHAGRKGDPRRSIRGLPMKGVFQQTFWSRKTPPASPENLSDSLDAFVQEYRSRAPYLRELSHRGCHCGLFCPLFDSAPHATRLEARLLRELAHLTIHLRLDVYPWDLKEREPEATTC